MKVLTKLDMLICLTVVLLFQPLTTAASDVQEKLKALKQAYEAGVLTEAEYKQKKTHFEKRFC